MTKKLRYELNMGLGAGDFSDVVHINNLKEWITPFGLLNETGLVCHYGPSVLARMSQFRIRRVDQFSFHPQRKATFVNDYGFTCLNLAHAKLGDRPIMATMQLQCGWRFDDPHVHRIFPDTTDADRYYGWHETSNAIFAKHFDQPHAWPESAYTDQDGNSRVPTHSDSYTNGIYGMAAYPKPAKE